MQQNLADLLLVLLGIHLCFALPVAMVFSYSSRKIGADIQARVGPNRVGPAGFLQAVADGIKLLQKRSLDTKPDPERIWVYFQIAALHSALVSVPIVSGFLLAENELSVFLPVIAIIAVVFAEFFLNLVRQDLSKWMSGLRLASQVCAALLPAVVSIVTACMVAGSFSWSRILEVQEGSIFNWLVFSDPFVFISFFIFAASGMMLLAVSPFDSAHHAPDVRAGLMTNASRQRELLKSFVRFYGLMIWALMGSALFLGGWSIPFDAGNSLLRLTLGETPPSWVGWALSLMWVFIKTLSILLSMSIVGRIMPRVRFDHVIQLGWRVLGPTSLVCLVFAAVLRASGGTL